MALRSFARVLWRLFLIILFIVIGIALVSVAFMTFAPTFGAKPTGDSIAKINASPNFKNGSFVNLVETSVSTQEPGSSMNLWSFIRPPAGKNPKTALPSQRFSHASFNTGDFVWLGHSTVLFKTPTLTVLTDPIFHRASPIPPFGKAFKYTHTPTIDDLPAIDIVLISHDHYDHLDHKTIPKLVGKTNMFLVPLGIKSHLLRWGVPADKITELDWYDSVNMDDTALTLTPSRHFSGRGLTDRNSTLWGSWVIKSATANVFFSGDSGYFDEFKHIGERYGPFDIAFIENGAYDKNWSQIHMMPEQSAQAAVDLKANLFFPIHWGKFDLAMHPWQEPIERAKAAAKKLAITTVSPRPGEVFTLDSPPSDSWWTE